MTTYFVLVILHILLGALWFGAALGLGPSVKSAVPQGRAAVQAATALAGRWATLAGIGALGALGTGVGLIFVRYGSMKALPVRFHIALSIVLVGTLIAFFALRPAVSKMARAAAVAEGWNATEAAGQAGKLSMFVGIGHLLWLAALVMMYAPF